VGSDRPGTTPEEALEGQGLDEALARERRDERTVDETIELADDGNPDVEGELVGEGFLVNEDYPSPEESALTIREEAPGATDHEDPDPAEED
jgi:hypothetical protein